MMITENINDEKFEKDSLAKFELLIKGYQKASQLNVWSSKMDELVEQLTDLPTAPFPRRLMKLFDYNYLVLSEGILSVIETALKIREDMKHEERFVNTKVKYFSLPFLPKNLHIKRLDVIDADGYLCYKMVGKIRVYTERFLKWLNPFNKDISLQDVVYFKQIDYQYKPLEVYYYSPFVNLSSTKHNEYYNFFCDYYAKLRFVQYYNNKETISIDPNENSMFNPAILDGCFIPPSSNLTTSQQVLWAYFFFRLIGLNLRINFEVSSLAKFMHIINKSSIKGYRNSYYYKLASKAPYVKEDKKLLVDLETVRVHFQRMKLPTGDLDKEILNLVTK